MAAIDGGARGSLATVSSISFGRRWCTRLVINSKQHLVRQRYDAKLVDSSEQHLIQQQGQTMAGNGAQSSLTSVSSILPSSKGRRRRAMVHMQGSLATVNSISFPQQWQTIAAASHWQQQLHLGTITIAIARSSTHQTAVAVIHTQQDFQTVANAVALSAALSGRHSNITPMRNTQPVPLQQQKPRQPPTRNGVFSM